MSGKTVWSWGQTKKSETANVWWWLHHNWKWHQNFPTCSFYAVLPLAFCSRSRCWLTKAPYRSLNDQVRQFWDHFSARLKSLSYIGRLGIFYLAPRSRSFASRLPLVIARLVDKGSIWVLKRARTEILIPLPVVMKSPSDIGRLGFFV